MRRPGAGLARRANFRGIGGAPAAVAAPGPAPFPALETGTFTRNSEGARRTGAATLVWDGVDVLRLVDRGDGFGPKELYEGPRSNYCAQARTFNGTGWTPGGTVALNQTTAPDGSSEADKLTGTAAGQTTQRDVYASGLGNQTVQCASIWYKAGSQGANASIRAGGTGQTNLVPTATWQRGSFVYIGSASAEQAIIWNVANGSSGSGVAGDNHFFDLFQLERARFASSEIRTAGATGTREADTLTFASALIPSWVFAGAWGQRAWPIFSETQMVSGDIFVLESFGDGNNCVRIRHNGDVRLEVVQAGTVRCSSLAVSGKSPHALWDYDLDSSNGRVVLDGVNGLIGTPWAWSAANMRRGGIYGGAGEAFSRIEAPVAA